MNQNEINQLDIFDAQEYCRDCDCWMNINTCKCEE